MKNEQNISDPCPTNPVIHVNSTSTKSKKECSILKKDELHLVNPHFHSMVLAAWERNETVPRGVIYLDAPSNHILVEYSETSNLVKHAENELKLINDNSKEQSCANKNILDLIKVLSSQEHSGTTIDYTLDVFNKLARFKALTSIENINKDPSLWIYHNKDMGDMYQSTRNSAVFVNRRGGEKILNKLERAGLPYYINAIVWCENEIGAGFTGHVNGIFSHQYGTFPFHPKTFYVSVSKNRVILNMKELDKALEYYVKSKSKLLYLKLRTRIFNVFARIKSLFSKNN